MSSFPLRPFKDASFNYRSYVTLVNINKEISLWVYSNKTSTQKAPPDVSDSCKHVHQASALFLKGSEKATPEYLIILTGMVWRKIKSIIAASSVTEPEYNSMPLCPALSASPSLSRPLHTFLPQNACSWQRLVCCIILNFVQCLKIRC